MPPLTLAAARAIVERDAATAKAPAVTQAEIEGILTETQRATVWAASTLYVIGQRVIPTVRTGCYFVAEVGGTSGSTEPVWPTGGTITDGVGVTPLRWRAECPDWSELYDLRRAIYRVWLLKAAKAAEMASFTVDGQAISRQQIYDHCTEMAFKYAPFGIG